MRNKTKLGIASLALGAILTAFGSQIFWSVRADEWTDSLIHNVSISFYVGIGLIVASVIFFVWAGTTAGKE